MSNAITTVARVFEPMAALPVPRAPIAVRVGTMADLPAIDALQKKYSRALGFFPRQQWEGYLKNGWVLVAEGTGQVDSPKSIVDSTGREVDGKGPFGSPLSTIDSQLSTPPLLGYCASRDRYQKRDELGAIFQMCVTPAAQRGLVAATLLKEVFARASYGCRLYCCWCAQDLTAANKFWEAMGFVPLAFRSGGRNKVKRDAEIKRQRDEVGGDSPHSVSSSLRHSVSSARVHIFWQKRIRVGDESTPWWFPSQTGNGALREDRIVLPIPPGVKWDDPMPQLLPESPRAPRERRVSTSERRVNNEKHGGDSAHPSTTDKHASLTGLRFGGAATTKADRPRREKAKVTPEQTAKARELRDRFLEQANEGNLELAAPRAKYDVARAIAPPSPARRITIDAPTEPLMIEAA